ncbi:MAG TPA: hypothetical protein VLI07_18780 [Candidatus Binatus sp.]|nr:hypothetical protein [Candidatus Binatus sp.]
MSEQSYERRVNALERAYEKSIRRDVLSALRDAVEDGLDEMFELEQWARESVTQILLDDPAWQGVEAIDISDIVSGITYEVYNEGEWR